MNSVVATAIEQRHALHRIAEVSNNEKRTAEYIQEFMRGCQPVRIHNKLGGHGLIAEFGQDDGAPVTLIRAELDALPIAEQLDLPYASDTDGVSHKCGHDGHMAILCGLAQVMKKSPPKKGRIALMFQPAEETGEGCARVIKTAAFKKLDPTRCFAFHNLPEYTAGEIVVRKDLFSAASMGLIITLIGSTAHAAQPHHGVPPTRALSQLMSMLPSVPRHHKTLFENAQATVIHARLGSPSFGTSPGDADLMVTLRADSDKQLEKLQKECVGLAKNIAQTYALDFKTKTTERFAATVNTNTEVDRVVNAARRTNETVAIADSAFRWSEDIGFLLRKYPGALFGIGAGVDHPALHHSDYDFPDEIIEPALNVFTELLRDEHY